MFLTFIENIIVENNIFDYINSEIERGTHAQIG